MTYAELVAALEAYTEDSEDLADQLSGIISRAEIRISKDLNIDAMNEIATQSLLQGTYWVSKPDDWIATLQFVLIDGTTRIMLEYRTESLIDDYYRTGPSTDTPRFYANWDQDLVPCRPVAGQGLHRRTQVRGADLRSCAVRRYLDRHQSPRSSVECLPGWVDDLPQEPTEQGTLRGGICPGAEIHAGRSRSPAV